MNKTIFIMKKLIVALCTAAMLGSAGTLLAKNTKETICHNGSYYNGTDANGIVQEVDISFVISIAGRNVAKAVNKHVDNHSDLTDFQTDGTQEICEPSVDGNDPVCKYVTLCGPVDEDYRLILGERI